MIHFCKSVGLLFRRSYEETLVLSSVHFSSVQERQRRQTRCTYTFRFSIQKKPGYGFPQGKAFSADHLQSKEHGFYPHATTPNLHSNGAQTHFA